MVTYHAKRLKALYGDGWYIVKRENGIETVMPMFYSGDFPESEYEATVLAHHLNQRSQRATEAYNAPGRRKRVNE